MSLHASRSRPAAFIAISAAILTALLVLLAVAMPSAEPAGADSAVQISVGQDYACAVTLGGGAQCWGLNSTGQLGVGTSTGPETCQTQFSDPYPCSKVPADVTGLDSGVTKISAGSAHTCAVQNGAAKCWGQNTYGQLGNGDPNGPDTCMLPSVGDVSCSTTPVQVSGLTSGVVDISVGGTHSCALLDTGGVKCWGDNFFGTIGDGTTDQRNTPVDVSNLASGVEQLSAGASGGCAVMDGGGPVRCWGTNNLGQLGIGNNTGPDVCNGFKCSTMPVNVSGLSDGVRKVSAASNSACALLDSGEVRCWGSNFQGQMGDSDSHGPDDCVQGPGETPCSLTPRAVPGLSDIDALGESNDEHYCVVRDGDIMCWGANRFGELGNGASGPDTCPDGLKCSQSPVNVAGLNDDAEDVSTGGSNGCARTADAGIKCWGDEFYGTIGDDGNSDGLTPKDVQGLEGGVTPTASPAPMQLPWGDLDCNGMLGGPDVRILLNDAAGLPSTTPNGCFALRTPVKVDGTNAIWGGIRCGSVIDFSDVLQLLHGMAGIDFIVINCPYPGNMASIALR